MPGGLHNSHLFLLQPCEIISTVEVTGLRLTEIQWLAQDLTSLVWNPRSNPKSILSTALGLYPVTFFWLWFKTAHFIFLLPKQLLRVSKVCSSLRMYLAKRGMMSGLLLHSVLRGELEELLGIVHYSSPSFYRCWKWDLKEEGFCPKFFSWFTAVFWPPIQSLIQGMAMILPALENKPETTWN